MIARLATVAVAFLLCAGALGCGDDSKLISAADAAGLKSSLQDVRSAVRARSCDDADARLVELRAQVKALSGVDSELRGLLRREIAEKLTPQVEAECDADVTQPIPSVITPAPEPSQSTAAPAPAPSPAPTPTSESTPAPEPTQSTESPPPPDPEPTTDEPEPSVSEPTAAPPEPSVPEAPAPEPDPGGFETDGGETGGAG